MEGMKRMKVTKVFELNYQEFVSEKNRFIVNEGGTGSSKTYSLCQLFVIALFTVKNARITICRKTFPALRATAMRDFFDIMREYDLYLDEEHNKTTHTYHCKLTNSEVEFISIDQPTKVRSRRRHYLWINEANELSYDDFQQLNMRTTKQIYFDYNPSYSRHWIYDYILTRPNTKLIKSTYLDNPFLPQEVVREILTFRETDENLWRVFGQGERAQLQNTVFNNYSIVDDFPDSGYTAYGLDFGYTNPTALVQIRLVENNLFVRQLIYQSYLTTSELIELLKSKVDRKTIIYADPSRPETINDIRRANFLIEPADTDVFGGINFVKRFHLKITRDSVDILREIQNYSWRQTSDNTVLDVPEKINDHSMDALRYSVTGLRRFGLGSRSIATANKKFLSDILL